MSQRNIWPSKDHHIIWSLIPMQKYLAIRKTRGKLHLYSKSQSNWQVIFYRHGFHKSRDDLLGWYIIWKWSSPVLVYHVAAPVSKILACWKRWADCFRTHHPWYPLFWWKLQFASLGSISHHQTGVFHKFPLSSCHPHRGRANFALQFKYPLQSSLKVQSQLLCPTRMPSGWLRDSQHFQGYVIQATSEPNAINLFSHLCPKVGKERLPVVLQVKRMVVQNSACNGKLCIL